MGYLADAIVIAKYRWRLRGGPVGHWSSRAGGGGFDMVHWYDMVFNADGTGILQHSGIILEPEEYPPGNSTFAWRSIGKRRIEILLANEATADISYDFVIRRNEYNVAEVCVVEIGQVGFWVSPYPMAHYVRVPASNPQT